MKAIVKKVSEKNPCMVSIHVVSGDFVVAKGWTLASTPKAIDDELEIPKGYFAEAVEGKNEAGQVFYKINWVR